MRHKVYPSFHASSPFIVTVSPSLDALSAAASTFRIPYTTGQPASWSVHLLMLLLLESVYGCHTNLSNSWSTKIATQYSRTGCHGCTSEYASSLPEMFYLLDFIRHASLRLHQVFSEDLNFLWFYYKHSLPRDWFRLAHAMWPAVSVTLYCDTCRPSVPACSPKAGTMSDPWWMTNVIYPVVRS